MIKIKVGDKIARASASSLDILSQLSKDPGAKLITFDSGDKFLIPRKDAERMLREAGSRVDVILDGRKCQLNANTVDIIIPVDDNYSQIYLDCGDKYLVTNAEADAIAEAANDSKLKDEPGYYDWLQKVRDHLYTGQWSQLDYDYACQFFYEDFDPSVLGLFGKGTTVWKNTHDGTLNVMGHDYSWEYNDECTIVVRARTANDRCASLAVCGYMRELTVPFLESRKMSYAYKLVPFMVIDGRNEHGVWISTDSVPAGDRGLTRSTNPESEKALCTLMLARYVLDFCTDAEDVVSKLSDVNVFAPQYDEEKNPMPDGSNPEGYEWKDVELHWTFGDKEKAYTLEIIDGRMVFTPITDKTGACVTNFYKEGAYTDINGHAVLESLTDYSSGVERYNLAVDRWDGFSYLDDVYGTLCDEFRYTYTYKTDTNPFWYTEFCGDHTEEGFGDLKVTTPRTEFADIVEAYKEEFERRTRDGATWQSIHTDVWNLETGRLKLRCQEDDDFDFQFDRNNFYAKWQIDEMIAEAAVMDDHMSDTSEHGVQNKVIKQYVDEDSAVSAYALCYLYSKIGEESYYGPQYEGRSLIVDDTGYLALRSISDRCVMSYWTPDFTDTLLAVDEGGYVAPISLKDLAEKLKKL